MAISLPDGVCDSRRRNRNLDDRIDGPARLEDRFKAWKREMVRARGFRRRNKSLSVVEPLSIQCESPQLPDDTDPHLGRPALSERAEQE